MASPSANPTGSDTANCPFPRCELIAFPGSPKAVVIGEVFAHISSDVRFIRAKSTPRDVDAFAHSDVTVDLQRVAASADGSNDGSASSEENLESETLGDVVIDVVAPRREHDNRALSITGRVTVRGHDQAGGRGNIDKDAAQRRAVWMIAGSREERDAWLLLLRSRVAPVRMWHDVCCRHTRSGFSRLCVQLSSICRDRMMQASEREMVDALASEQRRLVQINANESDHCSLPHGGESEDNVSDTGLLLHASMIQLLSLCQRIRSAASKDEFRPWHDGAVALRSMATCGMHVCIAVLALPPAERGGDQDGSVEPVLDALHGCWDSLVGVEGTLRKILSGDPVSDATKKSLLDEQKKVQEHAANTQYMQQHVIRPQANRSPIPAVDASRGPYKASFRVDVACSPSAARDGSARYEQVVEEILNTDDSDDARSVAVTSVKGEGGAGKTTTCVLALRDARVKQKYKDGVFAIEVGLGAQQKDVIQKISDIVEDCQGFATARDIAVLTDLKEAVRKAQRFYRDRRILLFVDNVWPENNFLGHLVKIADVRGSRVLFTTRSARLANAFTTRVVSLGTLNVDKDDERRAAVCILKEHLGSQRDNAWCSDTNVDDVLQLSQGLPLAIATLAALIRDKLVNGVTTNVLTQVRQKMASPSESDAYGLEHGGLFPAMKESLNLLDKRHAQNALAVSGRAGVMTQRFAALHKLDRSENRVTKHVLSYHWSVDAATAEAIAGDLFDLGLVTYAVLGTQARGDRAVGEGMRTLTLHDLQAEYSAHLAKSPSTGISMEEMDNMAVQGMLGGEGVDIDSLNAHDIVHRCGQICEVDEGGEDHGGRYVVSNLTRHLVGSLTPQNTARRWSTIVRVLSDSRWLFMWQRVDGWQYVYNQYITIKDKLPSTQILVSLSRGEVETVSEIGRAAREVPCGERWFPEGKETEKAAADLFRRVHAIGQGESENAPSTLIEPILRSLYDVAGEWWLRPSTACHGRAARHSALLTQFRVPLAQRCALVGDEGHVAVTSLDGCVRLFDKNGMLVDSHDAHSEFATGVCVGRRSCEAELRLFSVSEDGTLVLWNVTMPNSAVGHVRTPDPIVVDKVKDKLSAVACTADGCVVVAGSKEGGVYLWILNDNEGSDEYSRRMLAREHTAPIRSVAVSPDGATVVSGSQDHTCRVWRVADAVRDGPGTGLCAVLKKESEEKDRNEQVWSCTFADQGRLVVTGHLGGAVRIWRVGQKTPLHQVKLGEFGVFSLAAIGDAGREVVAGTGTGTAHVVRVHDGTVTAEIGRADLDTVRGVSASRGGRRVVACAHDSGRVELWDLERLSAEREADASTPGRGDQARRASRVCSVSSSPCGRVVASGHELGAVRCWSGRSGRCLWEYEHTSVVVCVCVSADAAHIACVCWDGAVLVLDARSGSIVRRWEHTRSAYSVSLHKLSDGVVWSGHGNGEVVVWRVSQDSPFHIRAEHNTSVDNLAVGVDGMSAYARDRSGRLSRLRIVDDGVEVEQVAPSSGEPEYLNPNEALFAELTAQGHRMAGHGSRHARVRHEVGGETHDVSVQRARHNCGVKVSFEIPDRAQALTCTADFDSTVSSIDAAISIGGDEDSDFVQIVCGLNDGRLCILRQSLTRGSETYDAAESWERFVLDGQTVSDSLGRRDRASLQPRVASGFAYLREVFSQLWALGN